MKKSICKLVLVAISLALFGCSTQKKVGTSVVKTEDGSMETYQALRIADKDELNEDGTKIIKKPSIIVIGEGAPVDIKATAIKSAQTVAATTLSRSLRQTLFARLDEKTAVIGGESVNVIRDIISSVTENIASNLKPGEVVITEKKGMYQVKAEMYIPGDYYVKALKAAASNVKEKIISNEKIENAQEVIKVVDEIFDGNLNIRN
ncbi:MAG: hypothetical protein M0P27_02990 [Bacteroidales bacterium]|nr:hypothetical protein [Bacteroidales bacterium]